jgi:hypothetical protein
LSRTANTGKTNTSEASSVSAYAFFVPIQSPAKPASQQPAIVPKPAKYSASVTCSGE